MGAFSEILTADRTFFYDTIVEGKKYQDITEKIVEKKLKEFSAGPRTQAEKDRLKTELQNAMKGMGESLMTSLFTICFISIQS